MGIPKYFSHIIRSYSNIILNLTGVNKCAQINHLYMDCNSIVYDAVHLLNKTNNAYDNWEQFETELLDKVMHNIEGYIAIIKPTKSIYIAFDGVAPFAKMEQQRTRRYKSQFMSSMLNLNDTTWNTSAITPGTEFMSKLNKRLYGNFNNSECKFNVNCVTVSGSDVHGEGEHKLFEHIRTHNIINDNLAVYGLDADLFMLSLFHLKYCSNIFIFREAPEFLKNLLPVSENSNELHFLNMNTLASSILTEMNCKFSDPHRIYDYVFICFFLGNDFLPHFPSMNIRTHGMHTLLNVYTECIGNKQNRYLISTNGQIQWRHLSLFIREISKNEHKFLLNEYNIRAKFDKFNIYKSDPKKELEDKILHIPIMFRSDEIYICPTEPGWESRYYKSLFDFAPNVDNINNVCKNYYEGLEWVFKYYSYSQICIKILHQLNLMDTLITH